MEETEYRLKYKMYFMVLYNLSPMQQGIQSLHAVVRYGRKFGHKPEFIEWADKDETVIVLSAGSSFGLNAATLELLANKIELVEFVEPDLYDNVTAICFLADERVWDREKYYDLGMHDPYILAGINNRPDLQEKIRDAYIESIGGQQNFFLRSFLPKYRLA